MVTSILTVVSGRWGLPARTIVFPTLKKRPKRKRTIASRKAATGVNTQAKKILAVSPQLIKGRKPAAIPPPIKPPVTAWEVETGRCRPVQIRTVRPAAVKEEKAITWAKASGRAGR